MTGTDAARTSAAAHEVERCRAHLAARELKQAAAHLAQAMALAADYRPLYTALDEFAAAVGSPGAAREYFKGNGETVAAQHAAVIVALIAAEGDHGTALRLLGSVVATDPALPWAGAAWFGPHLAGTVSPRIVTMAVVTIFDAVGYSKEPEVRAALRPWLALIRGAAARADAGSDVLRALSGAARRLDAADDAIAWCEKAARIDRKAGVRTPENLIMLGFAQRDAGDPARAIGSWEQALKIVPRHLPLHLDLADLTFEQKDYAASRRWAERALALDGGSVKARGALLAAKVRATAVHRDAVLCDAESAAELCRLAIERPQTPYLRELLVKACKALFWVNVVPPPADASAAMVHYAAKPENRVARLNVSRSMALEVPSAVYGARTHHPDAEFTNGEVLEPDPRTPCTTRYGSPLWSYRGTQAVPCVPPPSEDAVALLHKVAGGVWAEPLVAYEHAAPLGALSEQDLLGLLAHVPPAEQFGRLMDGVNGLYWNRVAQAWVCLGILHHRMHEEPWAQSTRRSLLLRLLHGPEDWTVDSAAFALGVAAWMMPEHAADIAAELAERYRFAAQALGRRFSSLHEPLAAATLVCPAMDPAVVAQILSDLDTQRRETVEAEVAKGRLRRRLAAIGVKVADPGR